jgi:3-deoxy-D-manno-octulosonate 8-phosphate phosphatase (KDO 8-P phosphatase)
VEPVEQILRLRQIRALLCDVDGVLTDGRLWYGADGEELKAFHARDGLAIKELMQRGIQVALVSGRDSPALRRRMADLGIQHAVLGQPDKASACRQIAAELGVDLEACAYVGDDSLDLPGMDLCGWSFAVADAAEVVQSAACSVLSSPGGQGAIREVAQMLLEAMP